MERTLRSHRFNRKDKSQVSVADILGRLDKEKELAAARAGMSRIAIDLDNNKAVIQQVGTHRADTRQNRKNNVNTRPSNRVENDNTGPNRQKSRRMRKFVGGFLVAASVLGVSGAIAACSKEAPKEAANVENVVEQNSNNVPQEGWNMFRYGAEEYKQVYGDRTDPFNFANSYNLQDTPESIKGFKENHMKIVRGNSALADYFTTAAGMHAEGDTLGSPDQGKYLYENRDKAEKLINDYEKRFMETPGKVSYETGSYVSDELDHATNTVRPTTVIFGESATWVTDLNNDKINEVYQVICGNQMRTEVDNPAPVFYPTPVNEYVYTPTPVHYDTPTVWTPPQQDHPTPPVHPPKPPKPPVPPVTPPQPPKPPKPPVPPVVPPVPPEVKGNNYPTNPFITNDLGPGEYMPTPADVATVIVTPGSNGRPDVVDTVTNNQGTETGGNAGNTTRDTIDTSSNAGSGGGIEGGNSNTGIGGGNTNAGDPGSR